MLKVQIAVAATLLVVLPAAAAAQEPPAQASEAEGVISYTPADFAAARPNTALDMLNRLPGFSVDGGENVRGFAGAAGNVLVDGQRPTTKSDNVFNILSRIPIGQVARVDVIRGGAPGIDMQGRTIVANVITSRTDAFQQVVSVGGFVFTETGKALPELNYEATRRSGEHELSFQLNRGAQFDDSQGDATRTTVNLLTGDTLVEDSFNEADGAFHSGRLNYKGPLLGGVFSANGLLTASDWKNESRFFSASTDETFINRSSDNGGEIGLNYRRPLASRLELELIGLSKLTIGDSYSTGLANGSSSIFLSDSEAGESIGRTVLHYEHSPNLSFEGGGEVAFNYREQTIALTVDDTAIPLPASDVRVEELRGEAFVQSTWRINPQYSLEAGLRVEQSTISQSGDTALERTFTYPKPRLLATWAPRESDQFRFRVEREVGQLNFRQFASNVNLNTTVLSAGNAELKPDQTWAYEVAYERRFWDNGAVVLTYRHEDIADVADTAPFLILVDANGDGVPDDADLDGLPDEQLVSGPGNIGDGENDVFALNLTLPLKRLGVEGGEFKIAGTYQYGQVMDPLTGDMRRISNDRPYRVNLSYRHDLPARHLTFSGTWFTGWSQRYYLLNEYEIDELRNYWEASVEYKPTPGFTLSVGVDNMVPYTFKMERHIFDGPRDTGSEAFIRTERRESQVILNGRLRWAF